MFSQQTLLFGLLGIVLVLLVWGRWRYDLIAFGALVAAVVLGLVPATNAFDGFGHPATIIIALVLIVSKGLTNAGVVDHLGRLLHSDNRGVPLHIGLMSAIAAPLSAVMNNVAALALLMPVDLQAAAKAKRPPGMTLMALSFATILGGLVTLIGTPPNIVVASFRAEAMGEPFGMFDFAPVGGVTALAGLFFVALIGWRLIPQTSSKAAASSTFNVHDYMAEARVKSESALIGLTPIEVNRKLGDHDADLIAVVRHGLRHMIWTPGLVLAEGDVLVIEAAADSLDSAMGDLKLEYLVPEQQEKKALEDLRLVEMVVPPGAWLEGRTPYSSGLLSRFPVSLVGVSRRGKRIRQRLRRLPIEAGDVLLVLLSEKQQNEIVEWTGCLPLAPRGLEVAKQSQAVAATAIFAGAIALATAGLVDLPVALGLAVVLFIALGLIGSREVYSVVEWPVIVLLGSMIPLGAALETTGGTKVIADGLISITAGQPAWVALLVLMVVTMTLSDVLNNVATAVVAAPVGMAMANTLGVNPDPFLMGIAIASSCAFLTPIGHKNNILVLGPGGYRFGDYWRMGLPLEILIIAVSLPMLLVVWPL